MELSWIVLLPPLFVLIVALTTHNVLAALFAGLVTACLLIAHGDPYTAAITLEHRLLEESSLTDLWYQTGNYNHAYTFGFLIALGIIIELMTRSGGLAAYAQLIQTRVKTKRQAETLPLVIAPFLFLDDYLNNLVGGSVVRPLFDQFGIARAKLAYLLNALSSSQCLLIPASSWLAFILMQLQTAGVSCNASQNPLILADPSQMYIQGLWYLLYPILSIASAWFIVRSGLSYGPMRQAEQATPKQTILTASPKASSTAAAISINSFLIPLASFLIGIPCMMLYLNGWHPLLGGTTWCSALQNTGALFPALWWASFASCAISTIYFSLRGNFSRHQLAAAYYDGFCFMRGSLILLLFAWTLSSFLKHDIPTGAYLAHNVVAHAPFVIIPLICFLTSTLITASIGSSWGMIGIMIPLAIPLITTLSNTLVPAAPDALPLLLPTLGAILSGAAAGPHFSPITDAAIISSTTAGISPMEHIRTLMPYSISPFIAASMGFLLSALIPGTTANCALTIAGCILLMVVLHLLLAAWYRPIQTTENFR